MADARRGDLLADFDPLERFLRGRRVCRLGDLLRDDLDGVPARRFDLDLAVDVADLDAATGGEIVGLAPLGGLAVLEIGGDDIAPLEGDEADEQERHGDGRRDAGPWAECSNGRRGHGGGTSGR